MAGEKWLYPEGKEHVLRMKKWNQKLDQMYGEVPFLSNKCEIGEDCAYFEYLEQENLAEYLDDLLGKGEKEKLRKFLRNIWKTYRSFTAKSRSQ